MSLIARNVYDAIKTQVAATLGVDWRELRYVFDIPQNDGRGIVKGFGIAPEDAPPANTIIRAMTFAHVFQIVLTQTNVREQDDTDAIAATLDELYNKADDILHDVLNQQLGIPDKIMTVTNGGISAPEFLESYIVLRFRVIVLYRRAIP
jgi:hypothetical protein